MSNDEKSFNPLQAFQSIKPVAYRMKFGDDSVMISLNALFVLANRFDTLHEDNNSREFVNWIEQEISSDD